MAKMGAGMDSWPAAKRARAKKLAVAVIAVAAAAAPKVALLAAMNPKRY